jgi:hypothetical protein
MARLDKKPYPGAWHFCGGESGDTDFRAYYARVEALLAAIPQDRIVKFSRGDGYALYYVKSFKPLVLQHIPHGDAWQIDPAYMRGLRESDVRQQIEREQRVRALFAAKSPESDTNP